MELSKALFWDTKFETIDFEKHRNYVIEKVLVYGKLSDWRAIQNYYSNEVIKEIAMQARNLDAKTLSFLSAIYDIPKEQFRCYTTQQFTPKHWDY